MTYFQELDEYLQRAFSVDYWYDDACLYAAELVQKMTLRDWESLQLCWQYRSPEWQERCAYVLSEADSDLAIPLLLEMLQTADDNLTLTVIDSLRTMGKTASQLNLSEELITRLKSLAEKSPVAQIVMNEFLQQVWPELEISV